MTRQRTERPLPAPRASVVIGRRAVALRHAAFELLQRGEATYYSPLPGVCACGASNADGLWIIVQHATCCPRCVPQSRRCSRCRHTQPTREFRVHRGRLVLDSRCNACIRMVVLEHYHSAKTRPSRATLCPKTCITCGRRRPASYFFKDNRYVDGRRSDCRLCMSVTSSRVRPSRRRRLKTKREPPHNR